MIFWFCKINWNKNKNINIISFSVCYFGKISSKFALWGFHERISRNVNVYKTVSQLLKKSCVSLVIPVLIYLNLASDTMPCSQ